MSLRFLAVLPWLAALGCYREASPDSTFPETGPEPQPHYAAGPPGGGMDPQTGYAPPEYGPSVVENGQANVGEPPVEDGAADADPSAPQQAPGVDVYSPGPALAGVDATASAGGSVELQGEADVDGTIDVTDAEIDASLEGYGQWIDTDQYGHVWRPDATTVGVDFTPYASGGSWQETDAGWAFACDYPWGWLAFHFGRWAWFDGYWAWLPGHRWSPAWVEWRHGGGVVGWRPLGPVVRDHRRGYQYRGPSVVIRDHRRSSQHDAHWRFSTTNDFSRPHIRSHLYRNLSEGLRLTSQVRVPPMRGGVVRPSRELMRDRVVNNARFTIRDHRGFSPRGPSNAPPARSDNAPRGYNGRGYNPTGRVYNAPPAASAPGRMYDPRPRGDIQPGRNYNPPPAAPGRVYNPGRGYNAPPAASAPGRVYRPSNPGTPGRVYTPPSQPTRVYNAPPPRVYNAPAPQRVYSPPTRVYNAPSPRAAPSSPPPSRPSSPAPSRSSSPAPSAPSHSGGNASPSSGGRSHRR